MRGEGVRDRGEAEVSGEDVRDRGEKEVRGEGVVPHPPSFPPRIFTGHLLQTLQHSLYLRLEKTHLY